jgi:predicted DsbA family dithiol-disulfide isomerase
VAWRLRIRCSRSFFDEGFLFLPQRREYPAAEYRLWLKCQLARETDASVLWHGDVARIIIPIYFDYASTLCYVAWRIVDELRFELDFEPLWKGVPIRWRNHASRPGIPLGAVERAKIATVIAETGIQVTPPECWIDSDAALMGSELARQAGVFDRFHEGVFRGAFERKLDISHPDRLAEIAAIAGMDGEAFRQDVEKRLMASRLIENKNEADRFSALGYPTFILGEFPLIGIQPKEMMRMLITRFLSQRRRLPQA